MSAAPHCNLNLAGLCQGVVALAIPHWAPQLSAHRLRLQALQSFRRIGKASAVVSVITFTPHWPQVQYSRPISLLHFAPAFS